MEFKQWFEILGHDISADNKNASAYNSEKLSETKFDGNHKVKISPITNDLLNIWANLINKDKNLILIFPDYMLRTIPLLSYIYSRLTSRSALIFSSGSVNLKNHITKLHNQNYQLLRHGTNDYLYHITPICILKENTLEYVPYLIHAKYWFKLEKNREKLRQQLISSELPKIMLNGSNNLTKLTDVINNVVFDKNDIDSNINLDVGCVIFENADRLLDSKFKMNAFIDWSKKATDKGIKFLFHFSKPNHDFIKEFQKETNSLILDFSNNILSNNVISHVSKKYFKNEDIDFSILNNYNLDLSSNHFSEFNVSIVNPILENGNLDLYNYHAQRTIDLIDKNSLKDSRAYSLPINLLYLLPNLAIDPTFFKIQVEISRGIWRNQPIPEVIRLFRSKIKKENEINQALLNKLFSNISNIYYELIQCKHYFENNNYNRVSKSYKVLDIAFNKNDYFNDDKELIIGTYHPNEVRILNEFFEGIPDVKVIHLNRLYKMSQDLQKYNLLLPGIINYKFSSILEHKFNQILILAYDGNNKRLIEQQINNVLNHSLYDEKVSMGHFEEIYDYFDLSKKNMFFKEFNRRYENSLIKEDDSEESKTKDKSIREFFVIDGTYSDYAKSQKRFEFEMEHDEMISQSDSQNNETVEVTLHNLNNGEIYVKKLLANKKYLRFKDYDKLDNLLEVPPSLFKRNDYVIILDNNQSFFEIYLNIFEEDLNIDRHFIDYWRDLLYNYISDNNLKVKEVYSNFINFMNEELNLPPVSYDTFRKWTNGYAIAPLKLDHLKALAIFLNDDYLIENYEKMHDDANQLRIINRMMGRRLSRIIKEIVQNNELINYDLLSFEERNVYNLIKNSIFKVV